VSRATVRAAVAAWFAPPNVAGLNTLYSAMPKQAMPQAFRVNLAPGTPSGAVAVVDIERDDEVRIALGGITSGKKEITYTLALDLFMQSIRLHGEDAMSDFDTLIENVKARLRADRQIGTGGTIFRAGETLLQGEYGVPQTVRGGAVEMWGRVRFECVEIINA
jgi:hypothetical protein